MDQGFQNILLRLIGWLYIVGAVLMTVLGYLPHAYHDTARIPEYFLVGFSLLIQIRLSPRSKVGVWILSIYLIFSSLLWMEYYQNVQGQLETNMYFLYPIAWLFLLKVRWGSLFAILHLIGMMTFWYTHGCDVNIFGHTGAIYPYLLSLENILLITIQWLWEKHDKLTSNVAEMDSLTGLANRAGMMINLEGAIMRSKRFCLVHMDLQNFHRINLLIGSEKADQILCSIAKTLRSTSGVLDPARHYGDEFSFLFEGSHDKLSTTLEEIQFLSAAAEAVVQHNLELRINVGISHWPIDAQIGKQLWNCSELALKAAKSQHLGKLVWFHASMGDRERNVAELLEALREALRSRRLDVHFQPKIDLQHQQVGSLEALVRWHRQSGWVPPLQFISLAEQDGLIHELGLYVIEKSVEFLSSLDQLGKTNISVAINVSPYQLLQPEFPSQLLGLCMKSKIDTHRLWIEVTEGTLMKEDMSETIEKLRSMGFHFSLDDFGTGFSSLSYLTRFPFEELKVDKSFTDGLLRSPKEQHIFETILNLSRSLGMHSVVEGVETIEQLRLTQAMGADTVQGWVFAKAMPAEECIEFIQKFKFPT